MLGQFS